jgi:serine protease AprX
MNSYITKSIFVVLFTAGSLLCQGQSWFWVGFTDKAGTGFSTDRPQEFLSERAIQRRIRQNIAIDETDLPVSQAYIDSIVKSGATYVHSSKWLNGITVQALSDSVANGWKELKFVRQVEHTKPSWEILKKGYDKFGQYTGLPGIDTSFYGASVFQISQLNGHFFHKNGLKGQGMVIAVLDAGFLKADQMPALRHLYDGGRILGTRDFVNPASDFYTEHRHGMMVLSAMGSYLPGELVGTAPEASYWLLRTEDAGSEFLIEEDNWVAGAEFADSVGADIINSSLGYSVFDDDTMNHTYADMDGKTTRVTIGANMAVRKGMLVFASAGNEARNSWRYIIAPADGDEVVAVGAVDKNRVYAPFSSVGPASDGDVKPNLAAMGSGTAVQSELGSVVASNGTSFSSPVLAGMAACLWQANPNVSASELARVMMIAGHLNPKPDTLLGYGIPDMHLANMILNQFNTSDNEVLKYWKVFPNPFHSTVTLFSGSGFRGEVLLELTTISGVKISKNRMSVEGYYRISDWEWLPAGSYLLKISSGNFTEAHVLVKLKK